MTTFEEHADTLRDEYIDNQIKAMEAGEAVVWPAVLDARSEQFISEAESAQTRRSDTQTPTPLRSELTIGKRTRSDDWQIDAACSGTDTALFYQADNERGSSVRNREAKAKAICARCPVVKLCLRDALATNEPYGVWGGMSADERFRLKASLSA